MEKKIKLLVFCFFLVISSSYSQWIPVNLGTTANLSAVCYATSSIIYVAGYNPTNYNPVLYKSTNGGTNWIMLNNPANFGYPTSLNFNGDGVSGMIVGSGPICGTSNGGQDWMAMYTPPDTVVFWDCKIEGNTAAGLWAVGNKAGSTGLLAPAVVRCANIMSGTPVFQRLTLPGSWASYQLTAVSVTDTNICYISAHSSGISKVFKTVNGGLSWTETIVSANRDIWDLKVGKSSPYYGYAVGGDNSVSSIFKTTNNGDSWFTVVDQAGGYLKRFKWKSDTIYAVGKSGKILISRNGGNDWYNNNSGVNSDLNDVFGLDQMAKNAFIVGNNGTLLKTTNGGVWIQNISSEMPEKYSLLQNYPNPFNPATNIKFSIIRNGFVSIKVYDLVGKEAGLVFNSDLSAGTYEVTFNAENLTSGVYFYKLVSGSFTDTKRMVLLR